MIVFSFFCLLGGLGSFFFLFFFTQSGIGSGLDLNGIVVLSRAPPYFFVDSLE